MLLEELITPELRYSKNPRRFNDMSQTQSNRFINSNKSGYFGRVFKTKNDYTIDKIPHYPLTDIESEDAYMLWIRELYDSKIADHNPYAPRVYLINIKTDSNKLQKYNVRMEKLYDINTSNAEEIDYFIEKMFHTDEFKNTRFDHENALKDRKIQILTYLLKTCIRNKSIIKDPLLLEIINLITNMKYYKDGLIETDIHSSNYMVRRTPFGGQLVIVDPVA